jgi:hypothetical protein
MSIPKVGPALRVFGHVLKLASWPAGRAPCHRLGLHEICELGSSLVFTVLGARAPVVAVLHHSRFVSGLPLHRHSKLALGLGRYALTLEAVRVQEAWSGLETQRSQPFRCRT